MIQLLLESFVCSFKTHKIRKAEPSLTLSGNVLSFIEKRSESCMREKPFTLQ